MGKKIERRNLDLSKLSVGMRVSSYKDLCQLVGEKPVDGTSKIAQLKHWSRFMDFKKIEGSRVYEILDIYKIPKEPLEDKRKSREARRGIYKQYVEYLIMQIVLNSCDCTVRTSKRQYLHALGLLSPTLYDAVSEGRKQADKENEFYSVTVNSFIENMKAMTGSDVKVSGVRTISYYEIMKRDLENACADDPKAMDIVRSLTYWNMRTFLNRVDTKARGILSSTLKAMEKDGLIKTYESYNVQREDSDDYFSAIKRKDNDDVEYDEAEVIDVALNNALNQIGCKTESEAYLCGRWDEMHDIMVQELNDNYQITDVQKMLRITAKVDEFETPSYLKGMTLVDIIKQLNKEFIEGLHRQAESQHNKILAKFGEDKISPLKGYKKERASENYVEMQDFLSSYYMPISDAEAKELAKSIEIGITNYMDRK